jgi:hypothetical protein
MLIDSAEWVTKRRAVQHQPRDSLLPTGYHDCRPDDTDASQFAFRQRPASVQADLRCPPLCRTLLDQPNWPWNDGDAAGRCDRGGMNDLTGRRFERSGTIYLAKEPADGIVFVQLLSAERHHAFNR